MPLAMIWDLETINDGPALAPSDGSLSRSFPKLIYHSIVCIGALMVERHQEGWFAIGLATTTVQDICEAKLIQSFIDCIGECHPTLVSYNGHSFDLPVLRYRAMRHNLICDGLSRRSYFHRYTEDHIDLCDLLSSFNYSGKVGLDELSKALGLPGKPGDMDGSKVQGLYQSGQMAELAAYCRDDVLNTYRIWLRYELFRGALSKSEFDYSEASLAQYLSSQTCTPSA